MKIILKAKNINFINKLQIIKLKNVMWLKNEKYNIIIEELSFEGVSS